MGVRIFAIVLRALFIGALVAVTIRVSSPQSESFASVCERAPPRSITSSARASSVGGTVPVTNTAAHRNFRAQAAAKREQLLAQLA
jgi:hypothetical protein